MPTNPLHAAGAPTGGGVWNRIWFAPEHPATLLFVRVVVFTAVAADVWLSWGRLQRLGSRPESLWEPISLLAMVRAPQPGPWMVEALGVAAIVGALLSVPRSTSRFGAGVAAIAYGLLELTSNSFGKIDHARQIVVIMAIVLAMGPRPPGWRALGTAAPEWRWRWPVQLCRATFALMLFAAAWAKVASGGIDWVLSENLRNIIVAESLIRDPAMERLALWIASEPWRWQGAAAAAVLGEGCLILALVVRAPWLRLPLVTAGVGTMAGITMFMGLVGFPILAVGAIFVRPSALFVSRQQASARLLVAPLLGIGALGITTYLHDPRMVGVVPLLAAAIVFLGMFAGFGHSREVVETQTGDATVRTVPNTGVGVRAPVNVRA